MNNVFSIKIESSGIVNGVDYKGTGTGECDTMSGKLAFGVTFSAIAEGTDPFANLLGVLILPTVFGREVDEARNLLTLADGTFAFTQVITGEDVDVKSHGTMSRTGASELTWRSTGQGEVRLKNVSAIEPFDAIMLPQGPGKFVDVITIPLIEREKRRIVHALRYFTFTPESQMEQPQIRRITVAPNVEGLRVNVEITSAISLFSSFCGKSVAKGR